MSDQKDESRFVQGKALVAIGVILLLAGFGVWLAVVLWEPVSFPDSHIRPAQLLFGAACCFGPLACVGTLIVAVGGVLWWWYR